MDETAKMLKEITEAGGIPGYEEEIRAVIRKYMEPLCKISQDRLGSIICTKRGTTDRPRIMLAGHMDEIGFIVKLITKEGFIRFTPLGGWWDQVVLAQRVVIKSRKGDVLGVTGSKPPHLLTEEERKKVLEKKDMFIDIGGGSKEEVEEEFGVRPGDPIIPICPFTAMRNEKLYMAKAWDDRVGCGVFMSVIQKLKDVEHPNTVLGVGTVQEEVGLRGARTSAFAVEPDIGIVLESGIAGDTPGIKEEEATDKLGKGPTLFVYDGSMIPNLKLRDLFIDTAKENDIPLQLSVIERGGTDGGHIHLNARGVPCVVIGVPARYIHSHCGVINRDDYDNAVKLVGEVVKKLDAEKAAELTQ